MGHVSEPPPQQAEAQADRGHRLHGVVVNVRGDPRALLLACADDACDQAPPLGQMPVQIGRRQPLADVADECGHVAAVLGLERRERDLDRKLRAVLPAPAQLQVAAHRPRLRIGDVTVAVLDMALADALREQQLDLLAEQLAAVVLEERLGLAVDEHDRSGGIDYDHRVGCRLQQRREPLLALAPDRVGADAGGDVAHEGGREPAVLGLERTQGDVDRKLGPVLAPARELEPGAHGARARVGEVAVALLDVVLLEPLREQLLDLAAEQLVSAVAEELLGLGVDELDCPLLVDDHDCVRGGVEQRREAILRLVAQPLDALPLADVANEGSHEPPLRRLDRAQADVDRELGAVLAQPREV